VSDRMFARPDNRVHAVAAAGLASGAHGGVSGCCDLIAGVNGCTCIEHP
jgi:hypothetical protein